jgi:hypothetical protein
MFDPEEESMYKLHRIAALFILLVALSSSALAVAAEPRLVKGHDEGTFTAQPLSQTVVRTHDTGSGRATHIGEYHMVADENVNLSSLQVTNASFTITAENGDTLAGKYSGTAQFSPGSQTQITYYVSGPITGGSGRFAGITGSIAFFGAADLVSGEFEDVVVGLIPEGREP